MRISSEGLDRATLPIMPATVRELDLALARSKSLNRDIQQILLKDPAAAIALFRQLGRIRPAACDSLTDTAHAVSMLGMEKFKRLLARLPSLDVGKRGDSPKRTFCYSQSAHAASYAGSIATRRGQEGSAAIATAALLQQPAILALWATDPESAARATNAARDHVPYDLAFGAELGIPPDELNRRLAEAWSFPAAAREAMGDFNPFDRQPQTIRLADGLARSTAFDWNGMETEALTELLAECLHLERHNAAVWLRQQAVDAARSLKQPGFPLPAFELMLLPGAEDDFEIDHPVPEFGRRPPPHLPPPPTDLHSLLTDSIQDIQQAAGLDRVFFLMLNGDRSKIRTRLAVGGQGDDPLRKLSMPMASKHLFSLLMTKPQSLWLNTGNRDQYLPLLPKLLHPHLANDGFYAMSLWARNRPIGLFLGDGGGLDAARYATFRAHCQSTSRILIGDEEAA